MYDYYILEYLQSKKRRKGHYCGSQIYISQFLYLEMYVGIDPHAPECRKRWQVLLDKEAFSNRPS